MRSMSVIANSPVNETPVSFECLADNLRKQFAWQRLLQLVLDAVLARPRDPNPQSTRSAVLLTLVTYCYATRTLGSQEIEDATRDRPEVAYITRGMPISAASIRQFRRVHRAQIESSLAKVLMSALNELARNGAVDRELVTIGNISMLAKSWVSQAVLFDTAFNE